MQTKPAEPEMLATPLPPSCFRHVRHSLAYGDMHIIRDELAEFLQYHGVSNEHASNLKLALTEILSNLVKHPAAKASHLEIRASLTAAQLEMEVIDNSTPFADFNAKCKSALSGLHAGATGAESGYGLGCIVTMYKNLQYTPMDEAPDHLNHLSIMSDISSPRRVKKKIFLVDDDPISLHIHRLMLEDTYEVISFKNVTEAIAAFEQIKPSVVISDLSMPDMDGVVLRKALMEIPGGNTTPFIFLSGNTDNEHNAYISDLGVDDFLTKPISRERLHSVLARLLHRSRQIHTTLQGQFSQDITALLRPSLPKQYHGWNFVTRHSVAASGGGDFILHHQMPTNMMAVLADVMGHGKQAKFFSYAYAGYLRSMFRMYAGTLDTSHFLKYLSQSVGGDPLLESVIMTCQCFQFFPEGIIKISSAGHPRPILVEKDGAELIDVTGPLPGLVGDTVYTMKSIRLDPGDKILFMTDGFMEMFDRTGVASESVLKQVKNVPATELANDLWSKFQDRQALELHHKDDATIIVAEYGGPS